jgi:PKD repeat protein
MLFIGLCAALAGCPQPNQQLALQVSPNKLTFGTSDTPQTIAVRLNLDSKEAIHYTATPNAAAKWLIVEPAEGDLSTPTSPAMLTVRLDRTKLAKGSNAGTISVGSAGMVARTVKVEATSILAADFEANATKPWQGEAITFKDTSASTTEGGTIYKWDWDFGDGTPHATVKNPSHTYTTPGKKTVVLKITSLVPGTGTGEDTELQDVETKTDYIDVRAVTPPIAKFFLPSKIPMTVDQGSSVTFTDASVPGTAPITTRYWDFGDGQHSNETNPTHKYDNGGSFAVTLTVTSNHGTDAVTYRPCVTVISALPQASFTWSPVGAEYLANSPIAFTDTSTPGTAPISSWEWDFGDGIKSTLQNPSHVFQVASGVTQTFTVTLTIGTINGKSTATQAFTIVKKGPKASFTVSPPSPLINTPVQFTDTSAPGTSPIKTWNWNFGDGTPNSVERNPVHTYTQPNKNGAPYNVTLTVETNHGTDTATVAVLVRTTPPTASFTVTPPRTYVGHDVQFADTSTDGTAPITSWLFNFGDGTTSQQKNVVHKFAKDGTFQVSLTVKSPHGENTLTIPVIIDKIINPTPDFTWTTLTPGSPSPYEADEVTFTDLSTPGSAPITAWLWNFGDGGTSTQQNPRYTYTKAGIYTVSLTVTTSDGTKTGGKTIQVQANTDPTANFVGSPLTLQQGSSVKFTDKSTNGTSDIISWLWNFGDGAASPEDNQSSERNPSHIYSEPGTFDVTLKVVSKHGTGTLVKAGYVTVMPKPEFSALPTLATVGKGVKFTDLTHSSLHPIVTWLWNFGDGQTSSEQNPVHVYGAAGTYDVSLTVTLDNGFKGTTKKSAFVSTVISPPKADFNISNHRPYMWETVNFVDISDPGSAAITRWTWDLGDGVSSAAKNPSVFYKSQGTKTIKLTVTSPFGSDTATKTIEVGVPSVTVNFKQDKTIVYRNDDRAMDDPVNFSSLSSMTGGSGITLDNRWYVWQGDAGAFPRYEEYREYSYGQFLDTAYTTNNSRQYWQNPFHEAGLYHVGLTTLGDVIVNPNNPDDPANTYGVIGGSITKANAIEVREPSELDKYVHQKDDSASRTVVATIQGTGYKAFILELVSQTWKAPGQATPQPWRHWLTVIQPSIITNDTGLLCLTQSETHGAAPTTVDPLMAKFAVETGSVVATMDGVPNLPSNFTSADQLIAQGIANFCAQQTALPESLPLFPMAKSVFQGMNAVQWLLANPAASGNYPPVLVNQFVLAGGSENGWARGWTTWLAAVADFRVKGIIPIGFDALNLQHQFAHQKDVWGSYPASLAPYVSFGVHSKFGADLSPIQVALAIKELRGRVQRVTRAILHDIRDDSYNGNNMGNDVDNVNALKDMLYKEKDIHSWQVVSRLYSFAQGYHGYDYYAYQEVAPAAEYAQKLYNALDYYTKNKAGTDGEKYALANRTAGSPYDSVIYSWMAADAGDSAPAEDQTGIVRGMACKLIDLMATAERLILQHHHTGWMQFMIDPIYYNAPFVLVTNFKSEFGNRLQMPKYIINGTGDRFTAPDSSYYYFNNLSEQKFMRYHPGLDHELNGYSQEIYDAQGWYKAVVGGTGMPVFTWQYLTDEQLLVNLYPTDPNAPPPVVKVWMARNEVNRDFRADPALNPNPPQWTSGQVSIVNNSVFRQVAPTLQGYTAYYMELTYGDPLTGKPLVFTTDVRIVNPYESPYGNLKSAKQEEAPAGETK